MMGLADSELDALASLSFEYLSHIQIKLKII